ncbi:MAG: threonine/serine dehydratase, partial [Caldilineae bacterium]
YYSELGGAEVWFKCENLQHTGSFKARGALNKVLSLQPTEHTCVVTASTGNHGAAVAYALRQIGLPGIVYVPEAAAATKVEAMKRWGIEVRHHGCDPLETELYARRYAQTHRAVYIPPYNDPHIIAGQGTIGLELQNQLDTIDALFVAVGGGGLISGIAVWLKAVMPGIQIVGCSPQNSAVMAHSVRAGRILDLPSQPTLSDGTAGGVEPDAITFPLCRDLVDTWIEVSEEEIAAELLRFIELHHMLIEGAAAVPIAAYRKLHPRFRDKRVVILLCGANISLSTLRELLA